MVGCHCFVQNLNFDHFPAFGRPKQDEVDLFGWLIYGNGWQDVFTDTGPTGVKLLQRLAVRNIVQVAGENCRLALGICHQLVNRLGRSKSLAVGGAMIKMCCQEQQRPVSVRHFDFDFQDAALLAIVKAWELVVLVLFDW